jgi:hypothetical protein
MPDVALWCDVQLTEDRLGICFPSLDLQDATDISDSFPGQSSTYSVNGVSTLGYFAIDYTFQDISRVHHKFKFWPRFSFIIVIDRLSL